MTPKLLPHRWFAIIAAVALFASACGGDDPELSTPLPTSTVAPATDATVPAEPSPIPSADDAGAEPTVDPAQGDDQGDATADPDVAEPGGGEAVPTPTQAPVSGDPAFTAGSKLTTVGLDEIFFGDPVEVAAEQAGTEWIGLPDAGTSPECYTVQPAGGPAGIVFTVFAGRVERVDITNPLITTRSGAGVGSTAASLDELFGDLLEQTEVDGGTDIAFVPADADDRQFRIIWRTDGVATVSMRAGRIPVVLPTAPCG